MTEFVDTYVSCSYRETLEKFCALFVNVIGPASGRAAIDAQTDTEGVFTPATPAAGDPSLWYAAIRSDAPIALPEGISLCDAETSQAVLGVWA